MKLCTLYVSVMGHLQLGLLEAWVQRDGPVGAILIQRYTGVNLMSGSAGLGFMPEPVGVCLEPVGGWSTGVSLEFGSTEA